MIISPGTMMTRSRKRIEVPFSHAHLFENGENGAWYDVSKLSTLWQDAGRTIPVTATDQLVRVIDDLSGNGNHIIFPDDDARPAYKTDGSKHWLEPDGFNDWSTPVQTLDLGEIWSHVGVWRAGTYFDAPFSVGSTYQASIMPTPAGWKMYDDNPSLQVIAPGDVTETAVISIERTPASLIGHYNGVAGDGFTPYPYDTQTLGLALFTRENDAGSQHFDGRFGGGTWVDRGLTRREASGLRKYWADAAGITL